MGSTYQMCPNYVYFGLFGLGPKVINNHVFPAVCLGRGHAQRHDAFSHMGLEGDFFSLSCEQLCAFNYVKLCNKTAVCIN
jgi:hypothetical protein